MKKKMLVGLLMLAVSAGSLSANAKCVFGSEAIDLLDEKENNDDTDSGVENVDVDMDVEDIEDTNEITDEEEVTVEESAQDNERDFLEFSDAEEIVGEESAEENVQFVESGKCGPQLYYELVKDNEGYMTLSFSGNGRMYYQGQGWRKYCKQIKRIIFIEGMTNIIFDAFSGCSNLEGELKLPNSLRIIEGGAFENCTKLNGMLHIPSGVTEIGSRAFAGCNGLTGNLNFPSGLTTIGDGAFMDCSGFTGNLVLPDKLTYAEEFTFKGCSGFAGNLKLPSGLVSIRRGTFSGCTGLKGRVEIPCNLGSIGVGAFEDCCNLIEIVSADQLWQLEDGAFKNCTSLKSIHIGAKLEFIGEEVFENCPNLTIFSYENGTTERFAKEYGIPFERMRKKNINELTMIPRKIETQFYSENDCDYPQVRFYDGNRVLIEPEECYVRFDNNRTSGKCRMIVDGLGMYTGRKIVEFNIIERKFDVNIKKIPLKVKQSVTLKTPLKWVSIANCKSANRKIATVTKNGRVKGIKKGKTYITVTLSNGCTGKIPVTVQVGNVRASKLTLNAKKINLQRKKSFTLKPSLFPITAKEKVTYKSLNNKIATVNKKGKIVAKKAGTVTIRVTAGKAKATCKVVVKK